MSVCLLEERVALWKFSVHSAHAWGFIRLEVEGAFHRKTTIGWNNVHAIQLPESLSLVVVVLFFALGYLLLHESVGKAELEVKVLQIDLVLAERNAT